MKKYVTLKFVRFKSRRRKNFVAPAIHTVIAKAIRATTTVGDRHLPSVAKIKPGTPCLFVNRGYAVKGRDGLMLDLCAYTYGSAPEQFRPDLSQSRAKISTTPVVDSRGRPQEIAHTYRALAFGQCILLETVRGGGGIDQLEELLSWMIQTYVDDTLPGIELLDVAGTELKRAIAAGGGVSAMTLKIVDGTVVPDSYYSESLSKLREHVGGTRNLSVTWEATDGDLEEEEVIKAFKEYDEADGLDNIVIHLALGGRINHLKRYRERRGFNIMTSGSGNKPNINELKAEMRDYLDELRTPVDGWRMLNDNGNFVNPQVLKTK